MYTSCEVFDSAPSYSHSVRERCTANLKDAHQVCRHAAPSYCCFRVHGCRSRCRMYVGWTRCSSFNLWFSFTGHLCSRGNGTEPLTRGHRKWKYLLRTYYILSFICPTHQCMRAPLPLWRLFAGQPLNISPHPGFCSCEIATTNGGKPGGAWA